MPVFVYTWPVPLVMTALLPVHMKGAVEAALACEALQVPGGASTGLIR